MLLLSGRQGGGLGAHPSAADFITCSTGRLEEIRLLARYGSLDLWELRGVRIARCFLELLMIILSYIFRTVAAEQRLAEEALGGQGFLSGKP
jgi:hypothetical protein